MKKTVYVLAAMIAAFSTSGAIYAQTPLQSHAVVDYSVSYLRLEPDYESPLETQELMGTVVEVLESNRYWVKVTSPQPYTAWCTDMGLAMMDDGELARYEAAPKYICTARLSMVYSEPSDKSQPVCDLVMGDVLRQVLSSKGGSRALRKGGFVKVMTPSGRTGWTRSADLEDYARWQSARHRDPEGAVALAKTFVGVPYLWGGMSPKGFDCSGLVRICWLMNGVTLPRNASQQILTGVEAPLDDLLPGDLLFFGSRREDGSERVSHVGMYIGGGRFVHSSHQVRINSMSEADPDYYEGMSRLLRARRVF